MTKLTIKLKVDPIFNDELWSYLEGNKVKPTWVARLLKRTASGDLPDVFYRLCVLSRVPKVGSTVNVKKDLISVSDRKNNAIYAGCSYHNDYDTVLTGKTLALVEIHSAKVLLSYDEIVKKLSSPERNFELKRLHSEREYLVKGPLKGVVLEIVSKKLMDTRAYKALLD